jgi:hypothetical protein
MIGLDDDIDGKIDCNEEEEDIIAVGLRVRSKEGCVLVLKEGCVVGVVGVIVGLKDGPVGTIDGTLVGRLVRM